MGVPGAVAASLLVPRPELRAVDVAVNPHAPGDPPALADHLHFHLHQVVAAPDGEDDVFIEAYALLDRVGKGPEPGLLFAIQRDHDIAVLKAEPLAPLADVEKFQANPIGKGAGEPLLVRGRLHFLRQDDNAPEVSHVPPQFEGAHHLIQSA